MVVSYRVATACLGQTNRSKAPVQSALAGPVTTTVTHSSPLFITYLKIRIICITYDLYYNADRVQDVGQPFLD